MKTKEKTLREPLFHISKRSKTSLPIWAVILIKLGSVLLGLLLSSIILLIVAGVNPVYFFATLIDGNFGTDIRIWKLLKEMFLLLGVGLALIPAFKMKFWNLGGNGQILMGALASAMCMFYLGDKKGWSDGAVIPLMIISSILAGAIWAVIPAIFKAFFKTNESLFTLMTNYIAVKLVAFFVRQNSTQGSTMPTIKNSHLPVWGGQQEILLIVIVALLTLLSFVYFKFSKHGYEISVVGESENTAKYAGINVKKVLIRTMALSGAICGLIGLILTGGFNYSVSTESAKNMGFTAIMAAWLAKLDPFLMIVSTFFISFVNNGMGNVQTEFDLYNSSISNVVLGIIYFIVIAGEFFIAYQIKFRKKAKNKVEIVSKNDTETIENPICENDEVVKANDKENEEAKINE